MVAERINLQTHSQKRKDQYLAAAVVFGSLYVLLSFVCPG